MSGPARARLAVVALHRVAVTAEEYAIAVAAVADQEHGDQEHYAAYGARLAFQKEAGQVEHHEHDVRLQQRWVQRFRDEQHGYQPLQTVHGVATVCARTPTAASVGEERREKKIEKKPGRIGRPGTQVAGTSLERPRDRLMRAAKRRWTSNNKKK